MANIITDRGRQQRRHKACLLWFTGLSGAGKSTVADRLERRLISEFDLRTCMLDGDRVRTGLCSDLGFSNKDRHENIRRVGEVGKLFVEAGLVTLAALISPFREDRALVRGIMPPGTFIEVFVDTPFLLCEQRDVKGLYKKARSGAISNFTGIDSPYEAPEQPDIHLKNSEQSVDASVQQILDFLKQGDYIPSAG